MTQTDIYYHSYQHLASPLNLPDSLGITASLDDSEGLRPAPIPEVELIVGGDQKELSSRVEGQGGNGNIALCKPTLTATLQTEQALHFIL